MLLLAEPGELGRRVGRDAEHRDALGGQVRQGGGEIAGLLRAAGGHRGRVEVDDHPLAAQLRQGHRVAVGVRQGEIRRLVSWREPYSGHSPLLARQTPNVIAYAASAKAARPRYDADAAPADGTPARRAKRAENGEFATVLYPGSTTENSFSSSRTGTGVGSRRFTVRSVNARLPYLSTGLLLAV